MLDHHTVNVELERPPHKLVFLNALLSRIYAFLPRPADMLTTLLRAPIAEFRRVHREAVTAAGAARSRHHLQIPQIACVANRECNSSITTNAIVFTKTGSLLKWSAIRKLSRGRHVGSLDQLPR
jgi:hypothetical protein